ncbi:LysM peptidoglycan-binding domain-containing protein [Longimicrobium sp.]|uniref:LysM peptidoglycan-binding domain-containing protein n=1 Tax=Longimicrobium sp. TaxID=2029185 RepID=UPI002C594470|nr:LysM peptidoglycan-binding domain-containing protein [Longimicrobium sp.]HSU17627.1 LysM peptidoglycan-binding domain-containing protein [Longimicrobium sp.]
MHPTHFQARALPLALMLAAAAACTPAPYHVARPAPAPQPAPAAEAAPAPDSAAPEKADENFALGRVQNGTVGRELLGSATYDLPVEPNQWVSMELSFLVNQRHEVVGRWLERGDRYAAFVQETFAAAGIPRDLHHLAMVESGYQPTVRSRAGAVGMWQFMSGTGRGMGLRIDDQVDERMDPVRSTRAAARHLRQLWEDFGHDWALAAAAYNAGGGRISRGLRSYSANGFWDLAERGNLAEETRRYVPRLYAVTIIAKDPARFGFARPAGVVRSFEFDSMQVDLPTPLPVLARAGSISLAQLAELNPHLVRGTAPAFYWLWVPKGTGPALQQAYATSEFKRRGGYAWYTLRRGEDVAKVALASNLAVDDVRSLNLSTNVDALGRGDRVRLYADAVRALDARPAERLAAREADGDSGDGDARASRSEPSSKRRRTARRSDGDDDAPARRTATRSGDDGESSRRTASRSNDEGETSRTARRPDGDGDTTPRRTASTRRVSDDESSSRTRSSSSETRRSRSSGNEGASRGSRATESTERLAARHTVDEGETLYAIARKYDVTVDALREANDLGARATLQPGQRLRIPRASSRVASRERDGGEARTGESSSPRRSPSSSSSREHVVKNGETLWSIARSYDTTVAAIRDANDMRADSVLQPGQKLRIPRRAAPSDER